MEQSRAGHESRWHLFSQLPAGLFTLFVTVDSHRIAYPQPVTLETSDVILTLSSEGTLALQAAPAEKETAAGVVLSSQSVSQLPLNKRDASLPEAHLLRQF